MSVNDSGDWIFHEGEAEIEQISELHSRQSQIGQPQFRSHSHASPWLCGSVKDQFFDRTTKLTGGVLAVRVECLVRYSLNYDTS